MGPQRPRPGLAAPGMVLRAPFVTSYETAPHVSRALHSITNNTNKLDLARCTSDLARSRAAINNSARSNAPREYPYVPTCYVNVGHPCQTKELY
ncbi:unnamed protein product [Arctia plantaginis]|uniref:Uncharacterized protein n=1 Tax=Arctia plantaginis TaxID=874455 RepID=A0A8S1A170_ARCPL|nr:unnamed protein product [Arctia plantaginis]CAB3239342.1 unnamed protein product [Arctia plantaginis]